MALKKSISSTSKIRVEFGGIIPPAPFSPYARLLGITSFADPPFAIFKIPSSHPLITWPLPNTNEIGFFLW